MKVYLDNSATTKAFDEVTETMVSALREQYGNPSSLHEMGVSAEKAVKKARTDVAGCLGVTPREIIFTSGGTEADNLAIRGICRAAKRKGRKIITTRVEHPAVLETFREMEEEGFECIYLDVDQNCRPDSEQLAEVLDNDVILVSMMHVNNEVGTITDLKQVSDLIRASKSADKAVLHSDCVQSFGKIAIPAAVLDMVSLSGHKIHGPKGSGALWVRKGVRILPYMTGGGQEGGMRSGTENTPAIAGMGKAAELIARDGIAKEQERLRDIRNTLESAILEEIPDVKINSPKDGIANILNVSFLGTRGEVILHKLEQDGIYVSTGSACSSNKKGRSHVLTAMGLKDHEIEGALRFSFGHFNTAEEIDYVIDKLKTAVESFRRLGSFR